MKNFLPFAAIVGFLSLGACGTAGMSEGPQVGDDNRSAAGLRGGNLDDLLAQTAGVRVDGRGAQARIHVSGADYPNPPLFLIDDVVIGYDFGSVYSLVAVSDVESIRVIRATDPAAARWGARGGNGVIEIITKRGDP